MKPRSPPALGGERPASVHLSAEASRLRVLPGHEGLVEPRQGARGARGQKASSIASSGSWLDRLCALE